MPTRLPSEAAGEYVSAYNARSVSRLMELYDAGFRAENPLWSGSKDVQQTVSTVERVWNTIPGAHMEITNIMEMGERAVLEMLFGWDDPRAGNETAQHLPHRLAV